WQCSTLCLFNGFAAEVFAPAFPLVGDSKKAKTKGLRFFSCLKWFFLAIALFFTSYWILFLLGVPLGWDIHVIGKIEEYKYLGGELLMAMFFWVAFMGRGYCYYCPLGTVLALLGKAAGQRIHTNHTKCIQCNQCNDACAMSIDIKCKAQWGMEVESMNCVGCGHCIDVCPTRTLSYSTRFLDMISRDNKVEQESDCDVRSEGIE
ncbi:MAG: 4Fe-4S ferredoxin, partial [Clostridia bacterium]|nr:4Fe-4S ferredoxin [Clostridia bacterium]